MSRKDVIVSIHVVVVCGVMSHKPPCPGINSIEKKIKFNQRKKGKRKNGDKKSKKKKKMKKIQNKQIEYHFKREKKRIMNNSDKKNGINIISKKEYFKKIYSAKSMKKSENLLKNILKFKEQKKKTKNKRRNAQKSKCHF